MIATVSSPEIVMADDDAGFGPVIVRLVWLLIAGNGPAVVDSVIVPVTPKMIVRGPLPLLVQVPVGDAP
jgi:hypothetical protein